MKPPEGFSPLRIELEEECTCLMSDDGSRAIFFDIKEDAEFVLESVNTHESTQAELAQLREDLEIAIALMSLAKALEKAYREDVKRLQKERSETIIDLRGIADELEAAHDWLHLKKILEPKVDALLVKLGDLPAGYAKTGGEG